ncbi:phosphotransferase enzyme family-domain-containing protein [Pestalotiopsis sp. NC0098]|nr:phosphotransferase enzyme family-domain-containing protein [Pestalotiopsis sp. NC0098]
MAASNVNHEGFQRRLDVISSILNRYKLEGATITPVEYDESCPFPYNNFIYKIHLSLPLNPTTFKVDTPRPGTLPISASNIYILINRLSNPRANGLNNAHRVENEVAAQSLFRQHLHDNHSNLEAIIPAIYAWEPYRPSATPEEAGFGWTMCEYMPGTNLDEHFAGMELPEKLAVKDQVAEVLAVVQNTTLPPQLRGHLGGLTFDGQGEIVGGQMSILPGGPWRDYVDLWVSRFRQQLHDADKSSALAGWEEAGVRGRIDRLVHTDRVAELLEAVDTTRTTLIHGDFTLNNFLFDKTTGRVTALLDFDFSWISHPSHEFFTGLWDIGGGLRSDDPNIISAVVSGKFDDLDESLSPDDRVKLQVAKAWDAALAARGVTRPSSMSGISRLRQLMELEDSSCPSRLGNERAIERLKRQSPEKLTQAIKAATDRLTALLDDLDA